MDKFHALVEDLKQRLGPSSGINSEDVDPLELQRLMEEYISNESEWSKYAHAHNGKTYTRNLVDIGNGKSNLLILVWTPGKGSPVHDHANAHCIMKVLQGRLVETRFERPTVQLNMDKHKSCPLKQIQNSEYCLNKVAYMADTLGLHKIFNPDAHEYAVSLHLYTPPNAAVYGCNVYEEETGHVRHITQCDFYSEYGKIKRPQP
ncbi:cysteine dioxygenase type I [Lojkania enalia]|uniref:Cysteine dioxygenase n=1 Tax=Lojkania enalia TaxID=147567 RepID=A0A9P4KJ12_9PLEO|nr:cysteine dioxygenase type I [Didymosphaeria enalia]